MPEKMQHSSSQPHNTGGISSGVSLANFHHPASISGGSGSSNPWSSNSGSSISMGAHELHVAHFNPFGAAAHSLDTSMSPHAAAEAVARSKGYHGHLPSTAPLLPSFSSSSNAHSQGEGSPWLTSKERAATVAAANRAAAAKRNHLVLVRHAFIFFKSTVLNLMLVYSGLSAFSFKGANLVYIPIF